MVDLKLGKKSVSSKKNIPQKRKAEEEKEDRDSLRDFDFSDEKEPPKTNKKRKKEKKKNKDVKKQKIEETVVCVQNLPKKLDAESLKDIFVKEGIEVKNVRKKNKRFGHICLANPKDLDKALALNLKQIDDEPITVSKARPNPDSRKLDVTLSVKNLAEKTTEEKLLKFFPGSIAIRTPRRPIISQRRMVFIQFKKASLAEKALKDKQGAELDGNVLFLGKANEKTSFQSLGSKNGKSNSIGGGKPKKLIVKHLSFATDDESLKHAFSSCKKAKIARYFDTNKSKGYGIVTFDSYEEAKEAYRNMIGSEIDGKQISIDFAHDRIGTVEEKPQKLIVKNLSFATVDKSLEKAFSSCKRAEIVRFPDTRRSRGFGIVTFDSHEEAKEAYRNMIGSDIDGRQISIDFAREQMEGSKRAVFHSGGRVGHPEGAREHYGRERGQDSGDEDRGRGFKDADRGREGVPKGSKEKQSSDVSNFKEKERKDD